MTKPREVDGRTIKGINFFDDKIAATIRLSSDPLFVEKVRDIDDD